MQIVTIATRRFTAEERQALNVHVVPLVVTLDGKVIARIDITGAFYDLWPPLLRCQLPRSLRQGPSPRYIVASQQSIQTSSFMSSGLSGTVSSANAACHGPGRG